MKTCGPSGWEKSWNQIPCLEKLSDMARFVLSALPIILVRIQILTLIYRIPPDTLFCLTTFTTLRLTLIPKERAILAVW